jgi:hypothetical protein
MRLRLRELVLWIVASPLLLIAVGAHVVAWLRLGAARSRYQLVFWPEWKGIQFIRFEGSRLSIYRWTLFLGVVELRRWA